MFQSLIGILVGFDITSSLRLEVIAVFGVSIPDRDFSWFRPSDQVRQHLFLAFQSLIGILVGFDLTILVARIGRVSKFQSLIGILVGFD
jgi:hypothetical protein